MNRSFRSLARSERAFRASPALTFTGQTSTVSNQCVCVCVCGESQREAKPVCEIPMVKSH